MPVGASAQGVRSGGFRPDQISNLFAWYDATKLSGFSDGNSVGTWPDEQGSNDLTQATGSAQPTYQTNVLDGKPVVRYDGTDDSLTAAFSTVSQPITAFAVASHTDTGTTAPIFRQESGVDFNLAWSAGSTAWQIFAGSGITGGSNDGTSHYLFTATYDGASSALRQDGASVASGDAGTNGLPGINTGNGSLNGDIGEFLVYDASLSASDLDRIESYLSDKWSISI